MERPTDRTNPAALKYCVTMNPLSIPDSNRRWDCLSLGEVMIRLDPDNMRIHTARHFQVWEGGGEYNVARGLRRCFGLKTAIVTALATRPPRHPAPDRPR